MADYVVARCSTTADLSRLLQGAETDRTVRFRAAEKLVERQDLERRSRARRVPSSLDAFLREQLQRKQIDWKNRGLESIHLGPPEERASSLALSRLTGLARFGRGEQHAAAQIACRLARLGKVSRLDTGSQGGEAEAEAAAEAEAGAGARAGAADDDARELCSGPGSSGELSLLYRRLAELRHGVPAAGLANGGYDVAEDGVSLAREREAARRAARQALLRDLERSRLGGNSGVLAGGDATTGVDPRLAPGSALFRWLSCREPALGVCCPDTLVIEADAPSAVLLLNGRRLARSRSRKTERFSVPRAALASPELAELLLCNCERHELHNQQAQPHQPDEPLFVIKTRAAPGGPQSVRLLRSEAQVRAALAQLAEGTAGSGAVTTLQRYVRSHGRKPTLFRLKYTAADKGARVQVFAITSTRPFPEQARAEAQVQTRAQAAPGPESCEPHDETGLSAWLLQAHATGADETPPCSIVAGPVMTTHKGPYERPCEIAQALLRDMARFAGIHVDSACLELVRDAGGDWLLLQLRALQGVTCPRALRVARAQELFGAKPEPEPVSAEQTPIAATPLEPLSACASLSVEQDCERRSPQNKPGECYGAYCSAAHGCGKLSAVPFKVVLFDRLTREDAERTGAMVISAQDRARLGSTVMACRDCVRVYRSRARALDTHGADKPSRAALDFERAVAQAPPAPTPHHAPVEQALQANLQVPYSAAMLHLNSAIYKRMVMQQNALLRPAHGKRKQRHESTRGAPASEVREAQEAARDKAHEVRDTALPGAHGVEGPASLLPSPVGDYVLFDACDTVTQEQEEHHVGTSPLGDFELFP